jgi:hypothetical protein
MKNNLTWITISGVLLLIVVTVFLQKQTYKSYSVAANDGSAEQTVELYVSSALKGDEQTVINIVSEIPDSYSDECKRTAKSDEVNDARPVVRKIEAVNEKQTAEKQEFAPSDKFAGLVNSDSKNSIAFLEARYIFAMRSEIEDMKILNNEIYQDEAVIDVEYKMYSKSVIKRKFLLKNKDGWKVFMTLSSDSSCVNKNYAKTRPLCSKK